MAQIRYCPLCMRDVTPKKDHLLSTVLSIILLLLFLFARIRLGTFMVFLAIAIGANLLEMLAPGKCPICQFNFTNYKG